MEKIKFILIIFLLFVVYIYVSCIYSIPENIILINDEKYDIKKLWGISTVETSVTVNDNSNVTNLEINLFENINLRNITITSIDNIKVVPVGKVIGLKLYTNGILVVGMSEIEDKNNVLNKPYENTDIEAGDTILQINEKYIEDIEELKEIVNDSKGGATCCNLKRIAQVI